MKVIVQGESKDIKKTFKPYMKDRIGSKVAGLVEMFRGRNLDKDAILAILKKEEVKNTFNRHGIFTLPVRGSELDRSDEIKIWFSVENNKSKRKAIKQFLTENGLEPDDEKFHEDFDREWDELCQNKTDEGSIMYWSLYRTPRGGSKSKVKQ